MKTWNKAEIAELDVQATAYGKNLQAKEANANKHDNNGAGGDLNVIPGGDEPNKGPVTTQDHLS